MAEITEKNPHRFHLFNCDNTYDLNKVEALIHAAAKEKATVEKTYFPLPRMSELCEELEGKQFDCAVFVVHAHESRLSINEERAGIGYAKIYRTLLRVANNRVLIVIGGDDNYKDSDERDKYVLSRWARRKISSQFAEDYLDGTESFIFSWDEEHHPIHEEALEFYLSPTKKGSFVSKPRVRPLPPSPEKQELSKLSAEQTEHRTTNDPGESKPIDPTTHSTAVQQLQSEKIKNVEGKRQDRQEASPNVPCAQPSAAQDVPPKTDQQDHRQQDLGHDGKQEYNERGDCLCYRAVMKKGVITEVSYSDPPEWQPPDDILKDVKKGHEDEPQCTFEIWADRNGKHYHVVPMYNEEGHRLRYKAVMKKGVITEVSYSDPPGWEAPDYKYMLEPMQKKHQRDSEAVVKIWEDSRKGEKYTVVVIHSKNWRCKIL